MSALAMMGGGPPEKPEGTSFTEVLTETIQDCHQLLAHAPDPAHKAMIAKALQTLLQVQKEVYGPQAGQQGQGAQPQQGGLAAMLGALR